MTPGKPQAELAELARLEKEATPGPWWTDEGTSSFGLFLGNGSDTWGADYSAFMLCVDSLKSEEYANGEADSALIAAMRNTLPGLLARIAELEGKLASP